MLLKAALLAYCLNHKLFPFPVFVFLYICSSLSVRFCWVGIDLPEAPGQLRSLEAYLESGRCNLWKSSGPNEIMEKHL